VTLSWEQVTASSSHLPLTVVAKLTQRHPLFANLYFKFSTTLSQRPVSHNPNHTFSKD
jgi:hypothetical protein